MEYLPANQYLPAQGHTTSEIEQRALSAPRMVGHFLYDPDRLGAGFGRALSIGILSGRPPTLELLVCGLAVATVLSIIALGCSFLHLGRPGRACVP